MIVIFNVMISRTHLISLLQPPPYQGADAWHPNKVGLFFPLSYVEGVETLLNTIIIPRWKGGKGQTQHLDSSSNDNGGCLVVAQGGLAPVGIMLTKRNPTHIQTLMLTSPPTYQDITTSIPQSELERNYNFLSSPVLGKLAFTILESRQIIKFFSNLFLFKEDCDEMWLNEAMDEVCIESRTPVQVFNAGLLQHKSYEDELKEIATVGQSIVIVSGDCDKRAVDRQAYESELNNCTLVTIDGLNVLPYENPVGVIDLINELGY